MCNKTMDTKKLPGVNSSTAEHVLSVPVTWSVKALRTLESATEATTRTSGLGNMQDLFLIAEPEVAAMYVLTEDSQVILSIGAPGLLRSQIISRPS